MAEKSYPSLRSGVAARRSYPTSEVRGRSRQDLPHNPTPEAGAATRRSYSTSKELWLHGHRKA